jgi:hypothetical protein
MHKNRQMLSRGLQACTDTQIRAVPLFHPHPIRKLTLTRSRRGRVRLTNHGRLFFIQLYRWFPAILQAVTIIRPGTLARWHRAGFRGRE